MMKKYTKDELAQMKLSDLKALAEKLGIEQETISGNKSLRKTWEVAILGQQADDEQQPKQQQRGSAAWPWAMAAIVSMLSLLFAFLLTYPAVSEAARDLGNLVANRAGFPALIAQAPTEQPAKVETEVKPTEEPEQSAKASNCPATGEAQNLFGVHVARISNEPCAWTWRGYPIATTEAVCPTGWVCTWHVVGDDIVFHQGVDQTASIAAGTWRKLNHYPEGVCGVYANEKANGERENPSFNVRFQAVEGGVSTCPNAWLGEVAAASVAEAPKPEPEPVAKPQQPVPAEKESLSCDPPSAKWTRVLDDNDVPMGCGWLLAEGTDTVNFGEQFRLDTPEGPVPGPKTDLSVDGPATLWDLTQ